MRNILILLVFMMIMPVYAQQGEVIEIEEESEDVKEEKTEKKAEKKEDIQKKEDKKEDKNKEDVVEVDTEEEVVVTGTSTEKAVEKAPVKTRVISKEKMEAKNAATLADSLEQNTGVRVENNCQNCGFNQVRLNGLDGHYSQVLVDGKPTYSSLAGVYGLEHIPVEMIERVEIVKGGGSSLYGGNAIAGVINIITKKPVRNSGQIGFETQLMPEKGSDEVKKMLKLAGDVSLVTPKKKAALHVYGGGIGRQPWDENEDGFSDLGELRQVYGGAKGYLTLFKGGDLEAKFDLDQENRRGGDRLLKAKHKSLVAEATDSTRWTGDLTWKHEIVPGTDYSLSYDFAMTERSSYYGGDDEYGDMYGKTKNPLHLIDLKINQLIPIPKMGAMILTGGFQFSLEDLRDYNADGAAHTDERYTNISGLLQIDWQMAKWLELILGGRIDKHSEVDNPIFSPRVSLMLGDFKGFKSRTSFATGFRAPQIFDEDFHITVVQGEPSPTYNSDDLEQEKSWNISQQFEYDIEPVKGFDIIPSINGYYSQIKDAFATRDIETGEELYVEGENRKLRFNSGKTTAMGLEVELKTTWKRYFEFETGWTFEKAENDEADEDLLSVGIEEKQILKTPNYYGYFSVLGRPWKGLELFTIVDLTGPMKIKHEGDFDGDEFELKETPWFARWDINISYKLDLDEGIYLKPYFGVKNILNSFQDDLDVGADRDAGYIYGPRIPRTFIVGMKGGI